jgi:NADH-quinone oxidoreductase subunit N
MNIFSLSSLITSLLSATGLGLLVLVVESFVKKDSKVTFYLTVGGLFVCTVLAYQSIWTDGTAFENMVHIGGYGSFFSCLFLIAALLTVVFSQEYLGEQLQHRGEFYLLIIFATIGMMLMAMAADLITIFLGLELMSICLYVLAGFLRREKTSNEAALKYFLLGAFATGFLLYGIALIYGSSGTTNIASILEKYSALSASKIFWAGMGLLMVGFAFKVAAVPFHMWAPDVYEGSPTVISGFMSTGAKAAAFSALMLMFNQITLQNENLKLVISLIASVSMILGNVVAISQTNLKRMLAYSSIAHAGYLLVGVASGNTLGNNGVVFYLVAYTFMNIGAFAVVGLLEREVGKNLTFDDYAGLSKKKPFLAALMAMFMFSLSGIPPFAGFFGKYYIFAAAVNANLTWLAILGVLTSVVGAYYYLRLVVVMYFHEGNATVVHQPTALSLTGVAIAALIVLALGIFPSFVLPTINSLF